jgi:drug/metabolite transporter (DMT)-like permease
VGAAPPGNRLVGYLSALGAGALWGTTGPLSTALYSEGAELAGVGFWRIAVAVALMALWVATRAREFRIDTRGLMAIGLGGGALVALFEVAYQYAIAGTGVAGAAALLYTAPVAVAILAVPLLGESLTILRLLLAGMVMVGAGLTVQGGEGGGVGLPGLGAGVLGGLLAALAFAGTTLLARWAVPRYGIARVLFYEMVGGTLLLGVALSLAGQAPALPPTGGAWLYVLALSLGTILLANILFFGGLKRIEAAPTAVAATIEPVVGALLGLAIFSQGLSLLGWLGLFLVVLGVAGGYAEEAARP